MKKRIRLSMLAATLVTMCFVLGLSIMYISEHRTQEVRKNLMDVMSALSIFTADVDSNTDFLELGEKISGGLHQGLRVSILRADGVVLYDSQVPAAQMENHSLRGELVNAKKTGYGEEIRESQSTGQSTFYACLPMNQTYFIRTAMTMESVNTYLCAVLPPMLGFCAILLVVAAVFSENLSRRFTMPYQELADSLGSLLRGETAVHSEKEVKYPELVPIVRNVRELDGKLKNYVSELGEKSREVENILSAVDDGIIVLNRNLEVLTINRTANQLFPTSGNFKRSCRNSQLLEKISQTVSTGEPTFLNTEILSRPNKFFRCLVSPARNSAADAVSGVVITISDITEIKKLERARTDFLSNFSHEMKSPLTSIKGFAELMKNDMVTDPDKIKEYLSIMINETTRLVNLINDILKLSEIETGKRSTLELTEVDFNKTAERIRQILTFQADAKNIEVVVEGKASAETDETRFSEIILNLVDNAIKYNLQNGQVRVRVWEEGKQALVSVWDNGIGIPQHSLDRVFERFYRIDKSRARKAGSTGLGLSIVKHDVELLNGKLSMESLEGRYTCVTIRLGKIFGKEDE